MKTLLYPCLNFGMWKITLTHWQPRASQKAAIKDAAAAAACCSLPAMFNASVADADAKEDDVFAPHSEVKSLGAIFKPIFTFVGSYSRRLRVFDCCYTLHTDTRWMRSLALLTAKH